MTEKSFQKKGILWESKTDKRLDTRPVKSEVSGQTPQKREEAERKLSPHAQRQNEPSMSALDLGSEDAVPLIRIVAILNLR